ncbi:O-antigen polymerase [Aliarcobacter lanthieri]|uniref:O-antigen polymerase n=1 Tax=Aliarcobacter lanthieri TaxID=1355374 RepID=UPI003AAE7B9B
MIFFYGLLIVWIVFFELFRKKDVFVDFLSIFNLFFLLNYILVPFVYLLSPENHDFWKFLKAQNEATNSWIVLLSIYISYILIVSGFLIGQKLKISNKVNIVQKYSFNSEFKLYVLLFLVLITFVFLYSLGYGGIFKLISLGQEIRAGNISGGITDYFSYIAIGILILPIFFYSAYLYSHESKTRKKALVYFIITFIVALIYGLGTGGRGNTGILVIYLFIIWLNYNGNKITIKKIFFLSLLVIFVVFMIVYGRTAIVAMSTFGTNDSYMEAFISHSQKYNRQSATEGIENLILILKHMDHPFASLYPVIYNNELYEYPRLFLDYPRALVSLIPGIRLPEVFISSMPAELNNIYFNSLDSRIVGYNPVGWIGLKLLNGGFVWLVIGTFIAGMVGGVLNRILIRNLHVSIFMPAIFLYVLLYWHKYILGTEGTEFVFGHLRESLYMMSFYFLYKIFKVSEKKEKTNAN